MIYTIAQTAKMTGYSETSLHRHFHAGLAPAPDVQVGLRKCYSEEQAAAVVEFYRKRVLELGLDKGNN